MAKQAKDPQRKEGSPSHERLFQVFLILFGCALGAIVTCSWEAKRDTRQKECLVRLVKANVQQEMRVAKSLREYLTAKKDVERLVPQGFDYAHDPSLYLSLQGSFGQLEDALVADLLGFHRTVQSCINIRNLFQEGLSWCRKNQGKPLPEGYLENYLTALDLVERRAQQVLSTIESLYPSINLDTDSERVEPNVTEHDFGGYVPQRE